MSQSTSFPPLYSAPISGIRSVQQESEEISLIPPDKLADFTDRHGDTTPPIASSIDALTGNESLSTISTRVSIKVSEKDLQECLSKEHFSLMAGLALTTAAPLPFTP